MKVRGAKGPRCGLKQGPANTEELAFMISFIDPKDSILLLIDLQESFRDHIVEFGRIVKNSNRLISACQLLDVPIIVTEQYPKGLGQTVHEVKANLTAYRPITKSCFDCFNSQEFIRAIDQQRKNLILCGIESHVCMFQTALSAIEKGFNVYLVADALSSRNKSDRDIALARLQHEGAKPASVEMLIFQMIKDSTHERFKEILKLVKGI